jgi:hypothetical protein
MTPQQDSLSGVIICPDQTIGGTAVKGELLHRNNISTTHPSPGPVKTSRRPPLYNFTFRSLSEFPITDAELKLIAAAAIIGFSSSPNPGYKMPAASGTPSAL